MTTAGGGRLPAVRERSKFRAKGSSMRRSHACFVCVVAGLPCCGHTPAPDAIPPSAVPLVRLFDDDVALYAQSDDGRVFNGDRLATEVPALRGATSITGGGGEVISLGGPPTTWECASLADGGVACQGSNVDGTLKALSPVACANPDCGVLCRPGTYSCVPSWTTVPGVAGIVQAHRACGVDTDGAVSCWGSGNGVKASRGRVRKLAGDFAILEGGDLLDVTTDTLVDLHGVVDVSGSHSSACAVSSEGTLSCWGRNEYGTVGDGTTQDRSGPVVVGQGFHNVEVGFLTVCGRVADGTVSCWGVVAFDGDAGVPCPKLSTSRCALTPLPIPGLSDVVQIAGTSTAIVYALLADGSVVEALSDAPKIVTVHQARRP